MKTNFRNFLLLFIIACVQSAAALEPANKQASPEAHALINYLADLPQKKTKKIISGQFESWGDDVKPLNDEHNWLNKIHQSTGKWVGLMGIEYHTDGVWPAQPNAAAVDFWKQGGLIQLYLIMSNPASPSSHNGGGKCDINLVLKKGHPYRNYYFAELDKVAKGLQVLNKAGVVVFINPFAEMTANWFWWGGQDPQKFKQLYHETFNYLVKTKGLNNLLFIYEPSAQHTTAVDYYPGDEFVDMVGISIFVDYNEELSKAKLPMYFALASLKKPMALSQWGPRRGSDQTGKLDQPAADNLKLLRALKANFPDVVWWMNWSQAYAIADTQVSNAHAKELLSDDWVINRDDLRWRDYRHK